MNKEEEEEDNLCTFCTFPLKVKLEEEKKKKNIIRLQKCKHAFHRECFKRWHVWRQKEWEREMREMNWPKGSEEEKRARAKPTHECPLCRVEVEERFDFSKSNNISGEDDDSDDEEEEKDRDDAHGGMPTVDATSSDPTASASATSHQREAYGADFVRVAADRGRTPSRARARAVNGRRRRRRRHPPSHRRHPASRAPRASRRGRR